MEEYNFVLGGIPGFEPYYCTEDGKIFSKRRGRLMELHGCILNSGYQMVKLTGLNGDVSGHMVHRLVALTWLDNPNNLEMVNHLDGNRINNNLDNLEWVTRSQNTQHAYDTGLIKTKRPVCQVDKDGKLVKVYDSIAEAAKNCSASAGQISEVCSGRKRRTCKGYYWFYKEDYDKGKKTRINGNCKEILQYTPDGKFVRRYESIIEASKIIKLHPSTITHACAEKKIAGGFKWKHAEKIKMIVEKKKDPVEITDWKSLKEFPRYKISKEGKIYSCVTHKFLKISRIKGQRDKVNILNTLNKSKSMLINRLVALAYIPNPNSWPIVNHKDGDCHNNTVENLEWCTYQTNAIHAYENNLNTKRRGIIRTDSNGKEEYFDSVTKAAQSVKISPASICSSAKYNRKCKGYNFKYAQPI